MEHHVYFWLKEERKNEESLAAFEKGLDQLMTSSTIESSTWGKPAGTSSRPGVTDHSWDYGASLTFASMEDHDEYQGDDPQHTEFINSFKDWWEKVEVKDLG